MARGQRRLGQHHLLASGRAGARLRRGGAEGNDPRAVHPPDLRTLLELAFGLTLRQPQRVRVHGAGAVVERQRFMPARDRLRAAVRERLPSPADVAYCCAESA